MKTLPLLLFATLLVMEAKVIFAKESKGSLSDLANSLSRNSKSYGREKRIGKGFEWIIQGVNILGEVDDFISDRTKEFIRKLHVAYNGDGRHAYKNA